MVPNGYRYKAAGKEQTFLMMPEGDVTFLLLIPSHSIIQILFILFHYILHCIYGFQCF